MTDRELMQEVLDALIRAQFELRGITATQDVQEAITALRERLAQSDPVLAHIKRLEEAVKAQREMLAGLEQEVREVLMLAQDALHMATLPFPIDPVKTQRALEAVDKILDEIKPDGMLFDDWGGWK